MVIEDVPIESIKTINHALKDNNRSSLTYLSFDLVGLVQQTVLQVQPVFYKFPEVLLINTFYKYEVIIDILCLSRTSLRLRLPLPSR